MTISELFGQLRPQIKTDNVIFDLSQIFDKHFGKNARLLRPDDAVLPLQERAVSADTERLNSGYPLQYILGEWEFFGLTLKVGEGVLIPRADTEISVETALGLLKKSPCPKVADFCSGSGAIALAIAKSILDSEVWAVELSPDAMRFLQENIGQLGLKDRVKPVLADVLGDIEFCFPEKLDMIISNPPYITNAEMKELPPQVRCEPSLALFGGDDGLDFYRSISRSAFRLLKQGGALVFEVGFRQADEVFKIMEQNGFSQIGYAQDLCKINRCVYAIKPL